MISIVAAGLKTVAGAARTVFRGTTDAARVVTEASIGAIATPFVHASGHAVFNAAGQMLQGPVATAANAVSSAPMMGAEGIASLALPAAGGAAGAAAPMAAQAGAPVTAHSLAGGLPMQGIALPLPPQGSMLIS